MGYRDDFYRVENIIGITGDIDSLPTVYFRNAAGDFGHITQVHYYDWNQGRCAVETDAGYQIINQCGGGCTCLSPTAHEYYGNGVCFHPSRSAFVPLANLSTAARDVAAQAIWRCPLMKADPGPDDPAGRVAAGREIAQRWRDAHRPGPRGRRNAVNYTALGLTNPLFKIAYPERAQ
jgi:hypothetical protein